MEKKNLKRKDITGYFTALAITVLVVFVSNSFYARLDLTEDKRYTLSETTKNILGNLEDIVYIKIYLSGNLPPAFNRLRNSVRELLDEYRVIAKDLIQYEFINLSEIEDVEARNRLYEELSEKGLKPTNIQARDKEGNLSQKLIFPGALVSYNTIEIPVQFLRNNPGLSAEENINNSIQMLEYEFTGTIKNLTADTVEKVAFIEGHGELNELETGDITAEIANYFQVDRGVINGNIERLKPYTAIIIAKPTEAFPEEDKFAIDQYVMNGGKVLWFIDAVRASLDSLVDGNTVALPYNLNLDDMFFRYGFRINHDLAKDIQSAIIPVNTELEGNAPRFTPAPWYYFPLLSNNPDHPATRGLNLVYSRFASTIDSVGTRPSLEKTVLLHTSEMSKTIDVPAVVSLEEIRNTPTRKEFNQSNLPVAVLIEGTFESVFRNRMLSALDIKGEYRFKEESKPTSMLVVADGNIIGNDVRYTPGGPQITPLGYDKYSRQTFGNKEFIVNVMNFITGNKGLIQLRNRDFKLRLLDESKIKNNKLEWQLVNALLPVLIIIFIGLLLTYYRKRQYTIKF